MARDRMTQRCRTCGRILDREAGRMKQVDHTWTCADRACWPKATPQDLMPDLPDAEPKTLFDRVAEARRAATQKGKS